MNFSLRQLRAFLMVAELQNFTRAAERIHLSQAALSLMIREFEDQIGFKVFDRSTRMVSINAAGLKIYPVVQKTVMDLEDAIREAANISKHKDNLVRVAATSIVSTNILPKVIAALKQSHPLIEIELRDVDRASIQSLVDQGAVDVGLGLNYSHHAHFQKVKIGTCGLLLAGPSTGEFALPASTRDIGFMQGKSIYALPADNTIQITIDAFLATQGIESPIKNRFSNINTILAMIEANGGFAWLPSFTQEACQRYGLNTCLLIDHAHELEFGAILSNQSPMRASVASFLKEFRRSMDAHLK
jgi:DNA-binding transcriptional LysR family regulator